MFLAALSCFAELAIIPSGEHGQFTVEIRAPYLLSLKEDYKSYVSCFGNLDG